MRHKTDGILPDQIVSESPDLDRRYLCTGKSLPTIDEDDNEDSWDCQTPKVTRALGQARDHPTASQGSHFCPTSVSCFSP